jgi:hypothetical protein
MARGYTLCRNRDGTIELSMIDEASSSFSVKTRIPTSGANGQALISKLKDFLSGIQEVGRTKLEASGSVDMSIVAPHRYRDEIIALYAADAKKVAVSLGDDYKVVTSGIDRPVRWVRMGVLELALFVPYSSGGAIERAAGDDLSQRLTSLQGMRSAMYVASFALNRASWARGLVPPSVFRHNSARCSHSARQRARSAATCFAIKFVIASSRIGRAANGTGSN